MTDETTDPTTTGSNEDFYVSLKRTVVPVIVGSIGGVVTAIGVEFDPQLWLAPVSGLYTAVYYVVARWLEQKNPLLGKLLGDSRPPHYGDK